MSDVEDFLKRVAQMRAEAQARANQQRQPPAPKPMPKPQAAPQRQPPQRTQAPTRPALAQADVVEAELAERGDGVARHVREHLRGTDAIAEHTRQLGAEVDLADDKLEAHLHAVFDHDLGQLKKTSGQAEVRPVQPVMPQLTLDSIARLLRSPTAARDALILAEIFQRPNERW